MKSFRFFIAVAMVATLAASANAQEEKCTKCPASKASTSAVAEEGSCNGCTDAYASLPKMSYKVGDEVTCCSESAAAMAKKDDKPIHYVVGKKTFEDKQKAFVSLVEQTEAAVDAFITPAKCEKSGTTTIAGKKCGCPVDAGQKTALVKAAVDKVKMTYVVGKEKCACPSQAAAMAKKSGEKKAYVVAGKETCCEMTARLNLARAKFDAAVKALAAKTEAKSEAKGS